MRPRTIPSHRVGRRPRRTTILMAVAAGLVLAGCGEETDPGESGDPDPGAEDGVEPLSGEASTDRASADAEGRGLTVTDVRMSGHGTFDRIVFELDGTEPAGYEVGYTSDGVARAQGSGEPIEVAGDETLAIALQGIALPPDADEETDPWDGDRVEGPDGGAVLEVVEDTVFEGVHTFFGGTEERHPFVVDRLEDPQRIVIDVHHEGR